MLDRPVGIAPVSPPAASEVVVIGGGIAGVATAYYLARAGVPVTLCEKGRIAGEQSSRNWGWIRKQGRDPRELPAIILALRLWEEIAASVAEDIGWRRGGVAYLAESEAELARHAAWLPHAQAYQLDTRLLSPAETDALLGQDGRRFKGALFTPSYARAEPGRAVPALARAAAALGASIHERCAVRSLETSAGRVAGVVTERGRIACQAVVLAGGAWSALLLRHLGFELPQLRVKASVQRTTPGSLISESAVGATRAAFRRRQDGGYTVARSGAVTFDITPAALRHFRAFLPALRDKWGEIKLRVGRPFVDELSTRASWRADRASPFERTRVLDPAPDHAVLDQVMRDAGELFPQLRGLRPVERWAGMIDVTPDEIPVLGRVDELPGLFVATGFSGHGFGIGPAAGYLMAELAAGRRPLLDLHPFRFARFRREGRHAPARGLRAPFPRARCATCAPAGRRVAAGSFFAPAGTFAQLRRLSRVSTVTRSRAMSEHGIEQASERPALAWLFGAAAATLIAMIVSACNTMEGVGEDVSAAGGALSDGSEDVEDEID